MTIKSSKLQRIPQLVTFSVLVKHKTLSKLTSFDTIGSENVSFDWQIHPVPCQIGLAIVSAKT